MATCIEADSKQEAILAQATAQAAGAIGRCFAFSFVSEEVKQNFSSVLQSKGIRSGTLQLEIVEVNNDGCIRAQIKL